MAHNPPSPDKWPISAWYKAAPTIGDMLDLGWPVRAECDACKFVLRVNLETLIATRGRAYSLWNVRAECRRAFPKPFHCFGMMYFEASVPGAHVIKLWVDPALLRPGPKPKRRGDGCGWL